MRHANEKQQSTLAIGDWLLDLAAHQLIRGQQSVRIEPKAAAVLAALFCHRGEVLTKQQLIREVWGEIAVTDEVLTTAIYQLRRALGDDSRHPRYIETIPRRGYRLIVRNRERPRLARWFAGIAAIVAVGFGLHVIVQILVTRELRPAGLRSLDQGEIKSAVSLLRRASQLDPNDARTTGALALALALDESPAEARAAAGKALVLDPRNSQALTARALVALWSEWNWEAARRDLRAAASTGDSTAATWLAYAETLAGNNVRVPSVTKPGDAALASVIHLFHGDFDRAERVARRSLRSYPGNPTLERQLMKIQMRRAEVLSPHIDEEGALQRLEQDLRERNSRLLYLRVDRRLDPLRGHPRFRQIAAAVGP